MIETKDYEIAGCKIIRQIYESPHSQVYRAHDLEGQPIILKVLKEEALTPVRVAEYRREYSITQALAVVGVASVHELRMNHHRPALVIEDFGGESLDLLGVAGQLPLSVFLPLSISLSHTLGQVHAHQVVHKDINPSNIVFNPKTAEVKLIDFGLANVLPQEIASFVHPQLLAGTLPYLSPEQTGRMNRPVDYRSDFYALGVTFYELLTGQLPFQADDALAWVHHHIASQPVHPSEVNGDVPEAIAQIILKLMAKTAEARYQSATGLQEDLTRCWEHWQAGRPIPTFELAQHDYCDRFGLSQKLYGREKEIATLQQIFEQLSASTTSSLVLLEGYSGVGKSALVRELYRPMTVQQGHFIAGKYDQGQSQDQSPIPYQAFSQAFNQLCQYLLTESPEQLTYWRSIILRALKANGQLLIDIIPDLELIIGAQPPVAELGGQEAQNRFQRVFRNFVQSLAQRDHPLVLFIDDLQWADSASLQLLKALFDSSTDRSAGDRNAQSGLMLIGAYRNNEVDAHHPLARAVDAITQNGTEPTIITLDNLPLGAVNDWISETLDCRPQRSRPLSELVYQKTRGNAFFTTEFLKTLHAEKLLYLSSLPVSQSLSEQPPVDSGLLHRKLSSKKHSEKYSEKHSKKHSEEQFRWQWDIEKIKAQNITDNVVDLMTKKLADLPEKACVALQMASCLGSQFSLADLALITHQTKLEELNALMPAIQEGFLVSLDDRYKLLLAGDTPSTVKFRFQHDRVQQAAYELIKPGKKERFHVQIGQALWKRALQKQDRKLVKDKLLDNYHHQSLFEIVNHLNMGWALLTAEPSLLELVRLNSQAGTKALNENAYEAAQSYFETGLRFLQTVKQKPADPSKAEDSIEDFIEDSTNKAIDDNHYHLSLQMVMGVARATLLQGEWTQMSRWIEQAISESHSVMDAIPAYELQIEAAHAKNQLTEGIELTLSTLQQLGLSFSTVPDPQKIGEALGLTAQEISQRSLDEIVALPEMRSPQPLAIMRLIAAIITPCFSAAPALLPLVVTAQVRLALTEGNNPSAVYAYAVYGLILSGIVGDFAGSYNMGQLARQLLARYDESSRENRESDRQNSGQDNRESNKAEGIRARTQHVLYAFIDHWHEPLTASCPKLLANYELGLETGDFEYAVLSAHVYCLNCFLIGKELSGLAQEMDTYGEVMRRLNRATTLNFQTVWHQSVLNLLGESPSPSKLQGAVYDIDERLPVHQARQDATALLIAYFHQALLSYWFGEGETALFNIQQSAEYLQGVPGLPIVPAWHFYSALIHLEQAEAVVEAEKVGMLAHVDDMLEKLQGWSDLAAQNHEHRIALIQAEKARVLGDIGAAMAHYDTAIDLAQSLGYIHERALANERAAQFYQRRGNQKIGRLYLKEARSAYTRWGATAKIKDLEQRYAKLLGPTAQPNPKGASRWTTTETDSEKLDVMSVLKASQALASDIQLDKLLTQLMTLVLENAGAEKGYLVVLQQERWCIEAIATIQNGVVVGHQAADVDTQVPIGLLNYVLRTQKSVVLKNATTDGAFGHDPYIQKAQSLSVLCLPLVNQGKLNGIIYLENNLMADAFTCDRLTVLQLLSSQAAISLENAQLYTQLQQYSRTLEDRVAERTTKLEAANQELQRQTTVDGLTQITNRRGFDQALSSSWKHLVRAQQPISLLLCDVDHFKAYNDYYGHLEGDRCLQRIAQALQAAAKRQTDTVARYGGEEFALILPETTLTAAICLAEKVLRQIRQLQIPHADSPTERWVTLSIGVASCLPDCKATPDKLIAMADQTLYSAKSAGRNGYRA